MENNLEEGLECEIDFNKLKKVYNKIFKKGIFVLPVAVQDAKTRKFLMGAYANNEALEKSLKTKKAVFWSTSRNELWIKGESSGNLLDLIEVRINCEQNYLLYLVIPQKDGRACHTKDKNNNFRKSCFYRRVKNINKLEFIG